MSTQSGTDKNPVRPRRTANGRRWSFHEEIKPEDISDGFAVDGVVEREARKGPAELVPDGCQLAYGPTLGVPRLWLVPIGKTEEAN